MDIGSIVWFRQPAERTRAGTVRRGSINAAAAIEDQWREWSKGKIVSSGDDGAGGFTYSIDKLHEDGDPSGAVFDIFVAASGDEEKASSQLSEIELANVVGQASVETCAEIEDLTVLTHLHEPEILYALQLRYDQDLIYTSTGPILIALNPFKKLKIYGPKEMEIYAKYGVATAKGLTVQAPAPHAYSIADRAFRDMTDMTKVKKNDKPVRGRGAGASSGGNNQTILVSGESGAGKTETTKIIMAYLAEVGQLEDKAKAEKARAKEAQAKANGEEVDIKPQEKVLRSNPVLEAFGNARTVRNDNSSRFGKFIELQFDVTALSNNRFATGAADIPLIGASVRTYLLEKVRVVHQSERERNFHIFYLLGMGASEGQRLDWRIGEDDWRDQWYLNQSDCWERLDGVRDDDEYDDLIQAMTAMGFEEEVQESCLRSVAAVLHLGDIRFGESGDGAAVMGAPAPESGGNLRSRTSSAAEVSTGEPLGNAAALLKVDIEALRKALTTKQLITRTEHYEVPLKPDQSAHARDAMAKMVYGEIFEWVVGRINESIKCEEEVVNEKGRKVKRDLSFIGVLDIFGFESFTINSFEQLCINYCNETLQQQFNGFVLQREQEEYIQESILYNFVTFKDSTKCLELIEMKHTGILATLQEQCLFPKSTDESFANKLYTNCEKHPCFMADFHIKAVNAFVVIHYAGPVCYSSSGFLEKNMDHLSPEAGELLASSSDPFICNLQAQQGARNAAAAVQGDGGSGGRSGNGRRDTKQGSAINQGGLGYKFMSSLVELNSLIATTGPHYVRCLKPNAFNRCEDFDPKLLAGQLKCNGVLEAVKVTRSGFSNRFLHKDFLKAFKVLDTSIGANGVKHKKLPSAPKDAAAVLLARVLVEDKPSGDGADDKPAFSYPPTNKELQVLSVQVGRTKVFLRQSAYEQLERLRNGMLRGSATKIASIARRRACYKTYAAAKKMASIIQKRVRIKVAKRKVAIARGRRRAAIFMQCVYRMLMAKKRVGEMRRLRAAIKLQSWSRGLEPKKNFLKLKSALIALQCKRRMKKAKIVVIERRRDAKKLGSIQNERDQLKNAVAENKKKLKESNHHLKEIATERDEMKRQNEELLAKLASSEGVVSEASKEVVSELEQKAEQLAMALKEAEERAEQAKHYEVETLASSASKLTETEVALEVAEAMAREQAEAYELKIKDLEIKLEETELKLEETQIKLEQAEAAGGGGEVYKRKSSMIASLFPAVEDTPQVEAAIPLPTKNKQWGNFGGNGSDNESDEGELEGDGAELATRAKQAIQALAQSELKLKELQASDKQLQDTLSKIKQQLKEEKEETDKLTSLAETKEIKISNLEDMLKEWRELESKASSDLSSLSPEEAAKIAAMAIREKDAALSRLEAEVQAGSSKSAEAKAAQYAQEAAEEQLGLLEKKLSQLEKENQEMEKKMKNASSSKMMTHTPGDENIHGENQWHMHAKELEHEVVELKRKLLHMQDNGGAGAQPEVIAFPGMGGAGDQSSDLNRELQEKVKKLTQSETIAVKGRAQAEQQIKYLQQKLLTLFTASIGSDMGGEGGGSVGIGGADLCLIELRTTFKEELDAGIIMGSALDNNPFSMAEVDEIGELGSSFASESATSPMKEGMVAFPGSGGDRARGQSSTSNRSIASSFSAEPLEDPVAEHKRLLELIKLTIRKEKEKLESELSHVKLRLIASDDAVNVLEASVKKVRKASRAMSIDNMRRDSSSQRDSSNNLNALLSASTSDGSLNSLGGGGNTSAIAALSGGNGQQLSAAALADAAVYAGMDPYLAVGEVEPIVKLLCRPSPDQDVMGELLALENSGVDLAERTSVGGDRPLHLLIEFAQHHPPKVALAALKLFLAFSDANDVRTDGATPLHICLVLNPENAWFLAQPLVAAGADMNYQWHRPPPNWTEVIDDTTSRSYWYNESTGESSWELPAGVEPVIPSAVAASLAADPPLGLVDPAGGGMQVGEVNGVIVYGGGGGGANGGPSGFPDGIAIDSLLDDMLQSICAPQSWVPDNMFDACMSCDKPFSFLTRRHHCRHCGRLVCKQCQREMQGMTAWAVNDPDGDDGDGGRFSIAGGGGGSGGGRNSVSGTSFLSRRQSTTNRYDDSIADTIKVCRQCAAAHYRATLRRNDPRARGF